MCRRRSFDTSSSFWIRFGDLNNSAWLRLGFIVAGISDKSGKCSSVSSGSVRKRAWKSGKMKEMVGGCCVCSDERGWNENPLVYCDGAGCNVAVHQGLEPWICYAGLEFTIVMLFYFDNNESMWVFNAMFVVLCILTMRSRFRFVTLDLHIAKHS